MTITAVSVGETTFTLTIGRRSTFNENVVSVRARGHGLAAVLVNLILELCLSVASLARTWSGGIGLGIVLSADRTFNVIKALLRVTDVGVFAIRAVDAHPVRSQGWLMKLISTRDTWWCDRNTFVFLVVDAILVVDTKLARAANSIGGRSWRSDLNLTGLAKCVRSAVA